MFWKRKPEARPYGVPLDQIELLLSRTNLTCSRDGNALVVQHPNSVTRVEVTRPAETKTDVGTVKAVVTLRSTLPPPFAKLLGDSDISINDLASLGSLVDTGTGLEVGSRLTIYEDDGPSWEAIHLPLLTFAVIAGIEPFVGGLKVSSGQQAPSRERSEWTEGDLADIHAVVSEQFVANAGGLGLTAEFGLDSPQSTAMLGDQDTALWELRADQPHPALGGGLLSVLQLPDQFSSDEEIRRVCAHLNGLEMAALDAPPHFGAWCPGRLGRNPAYVSFFPNVMHEAGDVGGNLFGWTLHRAYWGRVQIGAWS